MVRDGGTGLTRSIRPNCSYRRLPDARAPPSRCRRPAGGRSPWRCRRSSEPRTGRPGVRPPDSIPVGSSWSRPSSTAGRVCRSAAAELFGASSGGVRLDDPAATWPSRRRSPPRPPARHLPRRRRSSGRSRSPGRSRSAPSMAQRCRPPARSAGCSVVYAAPGAAAGCRRGSCRCPFDTYERHWIGRSRRCLFSFESRSVGSIGPRGPVQRPSDLHVWVALDGRGVLSCD